MGAEGDVVDVAGSEGSAAAVGLAEQVDDAAGGIAFGLIAEATSFGAGGAVPEGVDEKIGGGFVTRLGEGDRMEAGDVFTSLP